MTSTEETAPTTTALSTTGLRIEAAAGPIVVGVDLTVPRGRTLGVVGESGSGKSMIAKAVTGLLPPGVRASGTLTIGEQTVDLDGGERAFGPVRGSRVVLLLQDPFTSLSPVHRCGSQILAAVPGTGRASRSARRALATERLAEVGLTADVADRYPFELSGGMRQRVAIAAALAAEPDVLLADEPTTALDTTTQAGILDLLHSLQTARQMGLVLITHDLELARSTCDQLLVLYAGQVLESGPAPQVLAAPGHPYTRALHASNPPLDVRLDRLPAVDGSVPRPATVLDRCPFAARCPLVHEECTAGRPVLRPIAPGRESACVLGDAYLTEAGDGEHVPATLDSSAGTEALVTIAGLTKTFPGSRRAALSGVDLEVRAGESVGVVGESGSGKTTLARCLIGLETPDAGRIEFHGALRNGSSIDRPPHTAMQIVFQDPYSALNPALRIRSTLAEALAVAGRPASAVDELLTMVGLPIDYADRRPRSLSGGERQRVAIARALATRPTLLVCDESVSALDVTVQAQVLNLLADLRRRLGLSLLFISHDLAVVRQVADRIYVMLDGEVVEQGSADQVLTGPEHPYTRRLMAAAPGRSGQEAR